MAMSFVCKSRLSAYSSKSPVIILKTQIYVAPETAGFVTHTIRQTENPALIDSWITNTTSLKMLRAQTNCMSLFYCFLYNSASVGYDKLLFHEGCNRVLRNDVCMLRTPNSIGVSPLPFIWRLIEKVSNDHNRPFIDTSANLYSADAWF
jgi:hypothetical protein